MRARNIKPGFFTNEILGQADPILSLLFAGLWCLGDKKGRLEDRPIRIKAEIFPYRENLDINRYLTELERLGFIIRYEVGSIKLIQIVNFYKHQSPHHTEKESILPGQDLSVAKINGCNGAVNSPLFNGGNPPDSLIPDSLIPDSHHPPSGGVSRKAGRMANWNKALPEEIVDITNTILDFWPDPKKDIQPKKYAAESPTPVPTPHSRFLAVRLIEIQRSGGNLGVCVEIAKEYVKHYRDGKIWLQAPENFFGKKEGAKWEAYYQVYITNQALEANSEPKS